MRGERCRGDIGLLLAGSGACVRGLLLSTLGFNVLGVWGGRVRGRGVGCGDDAGDYL